MEQALFFLVMLAGLTHVAEATCNITENTYNCSVTVGESLYIPVISNASGHQVWCNKHPLNGTIKVFSLRTKLMIYEPFINRTEFFINNGTFLLSNVKMNDSGQYIIEVFDPRGVQVKKMSVQLDVKEEPSTPWNMLSVGVGSTLLLILIVILLLAIICCVRCCCKKSDSRI